MRIALHARNLWKSHLAGVRGCSARVWALRGCSLDIEEGERIGLVGGRASGKTTLLQCLAGERRLDAGQIETTFARRRYLPRSTRPDQIGIVSVPPQLLLLVYNDDDGSIPASAFLSLPHSGAVIIASRDIAHVRAFVDRVVLLQDGKLNPVARVPARRVAERPAPPLLSISAVDLLKESGRPVR